MKNSTIFPFERNKYFYGKLLSVDDFDLEQKYYNDKRRMINRFICGTGVIAGMHVVLVDERTISIETGCAIDSFGREIVIDTPVIRKLSLIDGFETCSDMQDNYVYLCVEYREEENSPVHNIAGNSGISSSESLQNNRIREGCRMYLTNQGPEDVNLSYRSLYEESVTVYSGEGVTLRQICPRYVRSGQIAELKLEIENLNPQYLSFTYQLNLTCFAWEDKQVLTISFDEMMYEKTGRYTLTYRLQAAQADGVEASAAVEPETFGLYLSKQRVGGQAGGRSAAYVTAMDEKEEMIRQYHRQAMENLLENTCQETIYLCRIFMGKAADSYIIDHVENMPYRQYVMSNPLNAALTHMLIEEGRRGAGEGDESGPGGQPQAESRRGGVKVQNGTVEFDLSEGGQKGQKFFSPEIFHGLGLGNVTILTGVENEKEAVYGSWDIFEEHGPRFETAVRTFEDKGSFMIGIRLQQTVTGGRFTLRWSAVKNIEESHDNQIEKKIFIKPGILELSLRESHYLEANCVNMPDRRVEWAVRDNGGAIDSNGYYTAPNTPGVYEVTARSVAYPEVKASIFVVVREKRDR